MNWDFILFNQLYLIPTKNGLTKPSRIRGTGYKFINMGEIFKYDRLLNPDMELVPLSDSEMDSHKIEIHDLLFARQSIIRSGAGKCSIVMEADELTVFDSHIIRVRLDPKKCDPVFYFYYFSSPFSGISTLIQQGVQAGIRASDLSKLSVALPSLPTQRCIAAILSAYDDLIENNLRRIKLLEEAAQHIYREWFVRMRFPGWETARFGEDGLPEGWEKVTISDLCQVKGGKRLPKGAMLSEFNTGYPYLRVKDLKTNSVNLETVQFIDQASQSIIKRYTITTEEIYISNAGTIGLTGIIPKVLNGANLTENCAKLAEIKKTYFKNYLCWFLRSPNGQGQIASNTGGASQPKLALYRIANIELNLPDKTILLEYDRLVEAIIKQTECLTNINYKLKEARDILLPRLMNQTIEV